MTHLTNTSGSYFWGSILLLIFTFISVNLTAQTQLGFDLDAERRSDRFGASVSISSDGNRIAIGGPSNNNSNGNDVGHVRIFEWDGINWNQMGSDIDGESGGDNFGGSVSLSGNGNRVICGAIRNDSNGANSGHAIVYEWDGTDWILLGYELFGEAPNDESGKSVSISEDGSRIAIGAPANDPNGISNAGHVRIFEWDGTFWVPVGMDIDGTVSNHRLGSICALSNDGNRIVLNNDAPGRTTRVYEWDGTNWNPLGPGIIPASSLTISGDGSRIAIGSASNNLANVYEWNGTIWDRVGGQILGETTGDEFGSSVSLSDDGNRIAIGAIKNSGRGNLAGHVRIYEWDGMSWNQVGFDIDGEELGDQSGNGLSISGDGNRVGIGAVLANADCNDAGHVRIFQLPGSYCAAEGGNGSNDRISNFAFHTINNASTATVPYEDFSDIEAIVEVGVNYQVTSTIANGTTDNEIIIWIDLNKDSDFDDPGEQVYQSPSGAGPHSGVITIPSMAVIGKTRMRVRLNNLANGSNQSSCGSSGNGQVEDYTLIISKGSSEVINFMRGDYITINNPNLPQGNSPRTVEFWLKSFPEQLNSYIAILDYGTDAFNQRFALRIRQDRALYFSAGSNDLPTNRSVGGICWVHCAATFDGTTLKLYMNGDLVAEANKIFNTTGTTMEIGRRINSNTEFYGGSIDEVRVWDYARSAVEIWGQMFAELDGNEAGLVAYYNFNQGVPNEDNPNETMLNDLSLSNADGTLNGFDLFGFVSNWSNRTVSDPSCCNSCEPSRFVSGTLNGPYRAEFIIQSNGNIPNGNQVVLAADNSVTLEPPFEVELGALLEIIMNGCF